MNKAIKIGLIVISPVITLTALTFFSVWFFAPQVGGEWWPYIRFIFSTLGAIVVAKFTFAVASNAVAAYIGFNQAQRVFSAGSSEQPWTEEDVQQRLDKMQE